MKKHGLKAIIRKKHCQRKYTKDYIVPNILNRQFTSEFPLTKLVCDVTELRKINDKRYYLFSVLDLFNNSIVASNISSRNDTALVIDCLSDSKLREVILHSDQGVQFTSKKYKELSKQKRLTTSMSSVGNCFDNAAKESFFGHFKEEFYLFHKPNSEEELCKNMKEFVHYYNNDRIQMRFKMSPAQYSMKRNMDLAC
jgi:transposase InsO family protein